jgi:hypothetical protein
MTKPNNLQTWIEQERAMRAVMDGGPGPGVGRPDQVSGKTGLEIMQAMLRGEFPTHL